MKVFNSLDVVGRYASLFHFRAVIRNIVPDSLNSVNKTLVLPFYYLLARCRLFFR